MNKVVIKKYPNRRLYNTQISCYVALNDLFEMVKQGVDFVVIDNKTEEDITRNILTQIIFDQETKGYNLLPVNFLRQIIGCYQNKQGGVLPHYLEAMMHNFSANQDKLYKMSLENPLKMVEDFSRHNIEIIENNFKIFCQSFRVNKSDE